MKTLERNIEAYKRMQGELESKHTGKWVLLYNEQLVSVHDNFQQAAEKAVKNYGDGPYLIRQVGAPPVVLPTSVMYRIGHA